MIRVRKIQIPGLPTKEPRRLYVYLPPDYARSDRRYPVLYMFDGHNVFYDSHATFGRSWGMKEYLSKTKLPLIVVGVECNPEGFRRLNEYCPWDLEIPPAVRRRKGFEMLKETDVLEGLGRVTMDWMSGPLKEEIDRTYRTLPDRDNTLIAGSSMGGLMTLYAIAAYNHVYSRGAALSPSIWAGIERLHELLSSTRFLKPTRLYVDLGTGELEWTGREGLAEMFAAAAELSAAGADVAARVIPGAVHNEAAWEKRIPVFMDYLLAPAEGPDRLPKGKPICVKVPKDRG